ncbi:MAG: hypothetical protein AABY22_21265 [Nanoarchaeota archaeon]
MNKFELLAEQYINSHFDNCNSKELCVELIRSLKYLIRSYEFI